MSQVRPAGRRVHLVGWSSVGRVAVIDTARRRCHFGTLHCATYFRLDAPSEVSRLAGWSSVVIDVDQDGPFNFCRAGHRSAGQKWYGTCTVWRRHSNTVALAIGLCSHTDYAAIDFPRHQAGIVCPLLGLRETVLYIVLLPLRPVQPRLLVTWSLRLLPVSRYWNRTAHCLKKFSYTHN